MPAEVGWVSWEKGGKSVKDRAQLLPRDGQQWHPQDRQVTQARDAGWAGRATSGHQPCLQGSTVTRGSDCERDSENLYLCIKATLNVDSNFIF